MKILVTGSTGLVGSEAVKYFTEKGWEVIGIDNNGRSHFFGTPTKTPSTLADIRDYDGLVTGFMQYGPFDAVIHAAAQPSHDYSKENVFEDFEINARGTLNLLEAARRHSPNAVFVHCSTDKIYGDGMTRKLTDNTTRLHNASPFSEKTQIVPPLSPFGVSKLAADFYVQEYAAQGWLTTGVFRMGCITGKAHEGAEQHGFLAYLAKCIKEGITYKIYGFHGKQVRDQIHARDLISAFEHFIAAPTSGAVYNMGGGEERSVSVFEAAELIENKTGKKFVYEYVEEPRFGDRPWDIHDVSKFKTDYPDWEYEYSLDSIINDLCA